MKTHIIDIRLKNNAGICYPVCKTNSKLLDLDASRWPLKTNSEYRQAEDKSTFCKHCVAAWNKRYGDWAPLT